MGPTIAIWVEQHVYDHHGFHPLNVMVNLMADALSWNNVSGWSIKSRYDRPLDSRDSQYDTVGDCLDGFGAWLNNQGIYGDEDSQHLILDESSVSGLGVAGGGVNSVGIGNLMEQLDEFNPPRFSELNHGGPSTPGDHVHISIHEAGHNIPPGLDHGDGMHYEGSQVSWTVPDNNAAYSTPLQAGRDGTTNTCGESSVDPDNYGTEYIDPYYWDGCAGDKIS